MTGSRLHTTDPAASSSAALTLEARTRAVLKETWGFDTLRPLQADSIAATLARRDSLTVLPTGGGKSLCYQLPPLVTGELTLVVSPLISLMQDQVASLRFAGVCAAALHAHTTPQDQAAMRDDLRSGDLRLLFVAPERLLTPSFLAWIGRQRIGAVAIDEAHCISQWGHDFRPEYRRLVELRSLLPGGAGVPICAYTATATPRVREDIVAQLRLHNPVVMVGTFDRPNLIYRVLPRVDLLEQVAEAIGRHRDQASIVYCISRKDTESLAGALAARGFNARAYHAGLNAATRTALSADFRSERLNVICATVAFGMGIDRGDVRCVVHAAMPKSVEAYQQETGRAGRDGLDAECVLLHSNADMMRWKNLIALPSPSGEDSSPDVIHAQHELLDEMHRFVVAGRCRHQMLSEYFGQEYVPPATDPSESDRSEQTEAAAPRGCGACDFCLGELEDLPDAQETARKIISCVARCEQRFGAAHIADVLIGANTAKVRERGHSQLSTHGLLRAMPKDRVVSAINQLVDAGHLARSIGDHPVLVLTSTSMDVLQNRATVRLVAPKAATEAASSRSRRAGADDVPLSPVEQGLFEELRVLRRQLAQARGVPPFVILGDAPLIELSRVRPASTSTLLDIRGIGERKAAEFGTPLLACIEAYSRTHTLDRDVRLAPQLTPPDARLGQRAERGNSLGSVSAAEHFRRGATIEEVMALMQRARSTVAGYLVDFIVRERPRDIGAWVSPSDYTRIASAIEAVGPTTALRPIFEKLEGTPGYDVIKLVVAHRMALAAK
ncbi:MAG: RecQ family ATP-dependent DNA helicase [Phycisphaerales bacterium]|nr:RecQ family ATP-dependent DNA helicase [Phycisphaerales bacterium]